jgi:REP element-mobilizing transposase RayT
MTKRKCSANNRKVINKEIVSNALEQENYTIVEFRGNGNRTKHIIRCPNAHEYECSYKNFKNTASRCRLCEMITESDIENVLESEKYTILEFRGNGSMTKHLIRCPYVHEYVISYNIFKNIGSRCRLCDMITEPNVINVLEKEKYILVEFRGNGYMTKQLICCSYGHEYECSYNHFKSMGSICPVCKSYYSELLCKRIFEKIFPNNLFTKCRPPFLEGLIRIRRILSRD